MKKVRVKLRLENDTFEFYNRLAKSVGLPLKSFIVDMLKGYIEIGIMLEPPAAKNFKSENN